MECPLFCFRLAFTWHHSVLTSFWFNCEAVKFSRFSERVPITRNRGFRLEVSVLMTAASCCVKPTVPVFSSHGAAAVPGEPRPVLDNRGVVRIFRLLALGLSCNPNMVTAEFGSVCGNSVAEDRTSGDGAILQLSGMVGARSGSRMPFQCNCVVSASVLENCFKDLGDNTDMEDPLSNKTCCGFRNPAFGDVWGPAELQQVASMILLHSSENGGGTYGSSFSHPGCSRNVCCSMNAAVCVVGIFEAGEFAMAHETDGEGGFLFALGESNVVVPINAPRRTATSRWGAMDTTGGGFVVAGSGAPRSLTDDLLPKNLQSHSAP